MAENAKQIIEANGFQDVITVIQGKVEEIDLPVDKVMPRIRLVEARPNLRRMPLLGSCPASCLT